MLPSLLQALLAVAALAGLGLAGWSLQRQRRLERRLSRRSRPEMVSPPAELGGIRLGLVRFRAYQDTGGDYSFALALLDRAGSGVVTTCLYHRERCRLYARPVSGWASSEELGPEEREAIARARLEDREVTSGRLLERAGVS